jgi:hypothetical protein
MAKSSADMYHSFSSSRYALAAQAVRDVIHAPQNAPDKGPLGVELPRIGPAEMTSPDQRKSSSSHAESANQQGTLDLNLRT